MCDDVQDVVFRCCKDDDGGWEAYALSHSAYGFGDNLAAARKDITEALSLLLDKPADSIELNEYHERLILTATERHASAWLRAYQDMDPSRMLLRRELGDKIINQLRFMFQNDPDTWNIFDNGLSLNGDVIVLACLPDDMLSDVFEQVASAHRLYLAVPYPEGLYLRCINTNKATDRTPESEITIASFNLGAGSTVDDFIQATSTSHNHDASREEYLVA